MRENCKAVVARPTTVPIMSQSYVELHGLPNPSPSTVHKPHCGPYPNPTLSLSLFCTLSSSLLFLRCCPFCCILLSLRVLWHLSPHAFWQTWVVCECVCVWVDLRFGAWLAWRVLGSNLRVAASQHCRQSVSQFAKTLLKHWVWRTRQVTCEILF